MAERLKMKPLDDTYVTEYDTVEPRSCFYDFGVRQSAVFSDASFDLESDFVKKLTKSLFD